MNPEPVLAIDDIQGNSLGGFNKNHQALIPVQFPDDISGLKTWLASVTLTDLATVVKFKREMKQRISDGLSVDDMQALWINVCFTWQGLKKLTESAEQFTDAVFRSGLDEAASQAIGDNAKQGAPGERSTWLIGSPTTVPDMLIIAGSDRPEPLDEAVRSLCDSLVDVRCSILKVDIGRDLSFFSTSDVKYPSGHEHFGFKDGISQPGVRGRISDDPADWLTPRPASKPGPSTEIEYGEPGQALIWPGEFVFGYVKQSLGAARLSVNGRRVGPAPPSAADPNAVVPWWGVNGSFLVYRRLQQNVTGFRAFTASAAARASVDLGHTVSAQRLASLLVGRWPSGAPVELTPNADDTQLGADDNRNNDFDLSNDDNGSICPLVAHIRKVNPRNVGTDQGAPSRTLVRRLLRRGIPYGPPLPEGAAADGQDRGLLFLSYQTDIQEQFMFLASTWTNAANAPVAAVNQPSPGQTVGDGYDMIIGQAPTEDRVRFCVLHDGSQSSRLTTAETPTKEWVVATGGAFFFSPSISAIRSILAQS
jgi:Dyp-type peroxidase family